MLYDSVFTARRHITQGPNTPNCRDETARGRSLSAGKEAATLLTRYLPGSPEEAALPFFPPHLMRKNDISRGTARGKFNTDGNEARLRTHRWTEEGGVGGPGTGASFLCTLEEKSVAKQLRRGRWRSLTSSDLRSSEQPPPPSGNQGFCSPQTDSIQTPAPCTFDEMTHSLDTFLAKLQGPAWTGGPFAHTDEHSTGSMPCQEDRSPWLGKARKKKKTNSNACCSKPSDCLIRPPQLDASSAEHP